MAAPLTLAAGGEYLEARVGKMKLPAEMTAKVKFTRDTQEYRFDFTFPEFSTDSSLDAGRRRGAAVRSAGQRRRRSCACLASACPLIGELVRKGAFGEVWVPAFQAKDLALALDVRTRTLPQASRAKATMAVEQLVRAAWMIDAAGDTGNRGDVEDAYAALSLAAADVRLYAAVATGARQ